MNDAVPRPRRTAVGAVLGVAGEVLLTLGVLLGLFVVWQLWWTDVVAARTQADVVAGLDWVRAAPGDPGSGARPAGAPAPGPSAGAAPPVLAAPAHATTFATLHVPRWGPEYLALVSEGTTRRDVLDVLGVGHYEGTAMPGQVGNFAVAGHRVTYGAPFRRIEELRLGDPLVVQTEQAWYVYRVTATEVVAPHDVAVLLPVPRQPDATPTTAVMTLTTCHPMYSARERYVVHAELDHWLAAGDGVPAELTTELTGEGA